MSCLARSKKYTTFPCPIIPSCPFPTHILTWALNRPLSTILFPSPNFSNPSLSSSPHSLNLRLYIGTGRGFRAHLLHRLILHTQEETKAQNGESDLVKVTGASSWHSQRSSWVICPQPNVLPQPKPRQSLSPSFSHVSPVPLASPVSASSSN